MSRYDTIATCSRSGPLPTRVGVYQARHGSRQYAAPHTVDFYPFKPLYIIRVLWKPRGWPRAPVPRPAQEASRFGRLGA